MNWHMFGKRSSVVVAALGIAIVVGALTSTASAMSRGHNVQAENFSVTYVGIAPPLDPTVTSLSDLVLKQADGKFVGKRKSDMTVSILQSSYVGTKLMMNRPCNELGDIVGWCIEEGKYTWAVTPQMIHSSLPMNDTDAMFGPAFVTQIVDADGYIGFATYRVTVVSPPDPTTEGAIVTVSIDGYASKMKVADDDKSSH